MCETLACHPISTQEAEKRAEPAMMTKEPIQFSIK
jgi:hypothetical protein